MSRNLTTLAGILALAAVAIAGTVWLFTPGGAEAIALEPDDPAVVAEGKRVYVEHCASCHGPNLEGQPEWRQRRPDGKLPAPPHDPSGHTWHHPDRQLFELTKLGPAALIGGGYRTDMPGYKDLLSDAQIIAVLSFIKSTWPPEIRKKHDEINEKGHRH